MIIERKLPKNLLEKDLHLFKHEFKHELAQFPAIEIQWGLLNSKGQVIFAKKKSKIPFLQKAVPNFRNLIKSIFTKNIQLTNESFVVVTDGWSQGYFHWVLDVLPKLIHLENNLNTYKIILPSFYEKDFYKTSIELLGNKEKVFYYDTQFLVFKKITLAGSTGTTGNYDEQTILNLRNRFLTATNNLSNKTTKKIYISRNQASRRRIINESEILEVLYDNGFEKVETENLSFEQQIKLFSEAEFVVGVHGAGLTNLLFMQPNTNLLELRFETDKINNCYFSLSSALKINYFYCLGEKDNNDIKIDKSNFELELEKMMQLTP